MKIKILVKNKALRKLLSYTLALFACFLIFIFVSLLVFKSTILNEKFVASILETSSYSEVVSNKINSEIDTASKLSGLLKKQIYQNLISEGNVKNETVKYINSCINNTDYNVDTSYFNNRLKTNLDIFIKTSIVKNITAEQLNKNMDSLINECIDIYSNNIKIKYVPTLGNIIDKYSVYINLINFIIFIIIIILFGLIVSLNYRTRTRLRFIIYSFIGSTIMVILTPIIVKLSGFTNRLAISSKAISSLLNDFINGTFNTYYFYLIFLILILAILYTAYFMKKKISREKRIKRKNNLIELGGAGKIHEIDNSLDI